MIRVSLRCWTDVPFCQRAGHPQRLPGYTHDLERLSVQLLARYEPYCHLSRRAKGLVSSQATWGLKQVPHSVIRYVFRMISGVSRNLGTAQVLVLVIESGMIYSAALIIEIACYFAGSNAFYILYDPIAQLTVSLIRPFSSFSSFSFRFCQSIVPTMILLLVGFRQTSNDIKSRATATTKPHVGAGSLPTVNFRTNPDLTATTATTDPRSTEPSVPKITFESLDTPSSISESSKAGGFKAEVIEFDTRRVSTNSDKNV
jgi:hypothetical protein